MFHERSVVFVEVEIVVAIVGSGVGFVVVAVAAVAMKEIRVVGRIDDGGIVLDLGVMFLEWMSQTRRIEDR